MPPHAFSVGDDVTYTVLRLLPNDAPDREYRVRNFRDGHEHVVRQSQIRRGLPPTPFG